MQLSAPIAGKDTIEVKTAAAPVSAEARLKAKVDSLRNALSEVSPARRSQTAGRMLAEADSLRTQYDFPRSVELLEHASEYADSIQNEAVEEALALARNGLNMMNYCSNPTVVARKKFALDEFFLMYPMEDHAWRLSPNALDSGADDISQAVFVPDSTRAVYFSAPDGDGIRNIYFTRKDGEKWSVPQLVNENVTSSSDEIYPTVSPDGRALYFASRGLYGMGGYDLYVSRWNREIHDWEQPVNMGFPYSSPYDDFLYINTDDGRYSVFASNRECGKDSVYIYVLEYDAMPQRHTVKEVRDLRRLSMLIPVTEEAGAARRQDQLRSESVPGKDVSAYMQKMADVRALRDSIYQFNKQLDEMRSQLADLPPEEQSGHISAIMAMEQGLPMMQDRLDKAVKDLQDIELDFLSSGAVLDSPGFQDDAEPEVREHSAAFEFVRHSPGKELAMEILSPEPADYTFSILEAGRFAESNELPDGLVYQVQFASGSGKLRQEDLHGLSPVFEKMSSSLRYTYTVGIFRSYNDALSHLNKVRKAGFKDAFITAFIDGKQVDVHDAREKERREAGSSELLFPDVNFDLKLL